MKIGYFTETYIPNTDGVVTSVLSFQHELEKRGHDVYVFAPGKVTSDGLTTFWYKSRSIKTYPEFPVAVYPSIGRSRTLKLVEENGIKLIHIHSPGPVGYRGLRTARKLGLPVVITYHTVLPELTWYLPPIRNLPAMDRAAKPLVWLICAWFFYQSDAIIVPSRTIKDELISGCGRWIKRKKIFVIPTGIDVNRFSGAGGGEIRRKYGLEKNRVVLHVGRVVREKRLETIVSAAPHICRKVPNVKFVVVGKGPALEEYKDLVKRKGLEDLFIFTGYVPDGDLPKYYAAADAFVIASDTETQGLVVLEAFASGKPVAAANARALPEFVKDGYNGFLFKPKNPRDCACAILKAVSAGELIRKNARKTAEKYSVERCTDRLLAVYRWAVMHAKS